MFGIKNFNNFLDFKNGFLGGMSEDFYHQMTSGNFPLVDFIEPNIDEDLYKIFVDYLSKDLIQEGKKPSYYNHLGAELYLAFKYKDSAFYADLTKNLSFSVVFDHDDGVNHYICWCNGEKYLMNPNTGSVDTADNWAAEGYTPENSGLVEVVKDENGDWVEL